MNLRLPLLLCLTLFINPLVYGMDVPLVTKERDTKSNNKKCAKIMAATTCLAILSVSVWAIVGLFRKTSSNDNNSCDAPSNVYWKATIPLASFSTGKVKTVFYDHLCPTANDPQATRANVDFMLYDVCPLKTGRPWFYDSHYGTPCFGSSTAPINGTCSDLDDVARDLGNKCGTNTPIPTTRNALQRQNNVMHGNSTKLARLRHTFVRR